MQAKELTEANFSDFTERWCSGYFDCLDDVPEKFLAIKLGYEDYFTPEEIAESNVFWKKKKEDEEKEYEDLMDDIKLHPEDYV